jgi:hypothetical protein
LTLVAERLEIHWQLIRLATKAAPRKSAADVAATPYAIVVPMVLDRLENRLSELRVALKNDRVLVAKEILTEFYDTEYALQVCIDRLDQCEWGNRLDRLTKSTAALVEADRPVSRQCWPRSRIEQAAQSSVARRPPEPFGMEGM